MLSLDSGASMVQSIGPVTLIAIGAITNADLETIFTILMELGVQFIDGRDSFLRSL